MGQAADESRTKPCIIQLLQNGLGGGTARNGAMHLSADVKTMFLLGVKSEVNPYLRWKNQG